MAFERLDPRLRALLEREGFHEPTPAQAAAMPPILDGKHTLLLAPTGMGKTESAVLPILHELLQLREEERTGFVALYVTPLRALNRDILGRLVHWCKALDITIGVRHGDTSQAERTRQSKKPPQFLITTPETLQALFTGSRLRKHLEGVRFVVVDEIHELVGDERGSQLACALERIVRYSGEFQRVGLSATVGNPEDAAGFLGGRGREVSIARVPIGKDLDVTVAFPKATDEDTALGAKLFCGPQEAAIVRRVVELVQENTSTLVFVNTRRMAEVLAARLGFWGRETIAVHHGSLHKDERVRVEESFKRGETKGLICTSSMELGIDIGSADFVVQINSPREVARLLQRVGRAGHKVGLTSRGAVIVTDADDAMEAMVIAKRATGERVETSAIPECPLDVLANQLEGLSLEGDVDLRDAIALIRRARPFWHLTDEQADATLSLMETTRLVGRDEGQLRRRRRARVHFVENLSMIPDQVMYLVRDVTTRKPIGTLDEAFVTTYIEPGALFIFQGHPWRVVELRVEDVDEPDILVAPVKDPTGAIPSWVGEEIPVPYEIAQDVGRLRGELRDLVAAGGDAVGLLQREHGVDEATASLVVDHVEEQATYEMPTDAVAVLEWAQRSAVLHACLGHKANEALGTALSGLVAARLGESVGYDADPYRVMLELPRRARPEHVDAALQELLGQPLEGLLRTLLVNAPALRFKMVHVARKFGVLDKGVSSAHINVNRLLERFRDSPLFDEAVREVLHERLDVPRAEAFLAQLASGDVHIVKQALSPFGKAGFEESLSLVSPRRATAAILSAMEKRLLDEPILVACLHCKKWQRETRVKRLHYPLTCPTCKARLATVVRPWQKDRIACLKKEGLSREERNTVRRLHTAASLVAAHGEDAVLLLVARGVGPDTAGRLLGRQLADREGLLRAIMEAEITYARTRAFWD